MEVLTKPVTQDTQNLVNYHVVKSVTSELSTKLEQIIGEMDLAEPSVSSDDVTLQSFNAYGGSQIVGAGSSTQHNNFNTSGGTKHNYERITGNPIFNFWQPLIRRGYRKR